MNADPRAPSAPNVGAVGEEEFKRLYELLARRVYAFAVRRLHAESAKDVVSETFETVWRKSDDAPPDHDACVAWIFAIAKFKVLQEHQRIRRKHHDNRFIDDCTVPVMSGTDACDVVVEHQVGGLIYGSLRDGERELFDLLFVRNVPRTQACDLLHISPSVLKTRLSRLRTRIERLELMHAD